MKEFLSFLSFLVFCFLIHLSASVHVFEVYRMIQYEGEMMIAAVTSSGAASSGGGGSGGSGGAGTGSSDGASGGVMNGSQRASLNSLAVTVKTLPNIENLARYVVMVQAQDFSVDLVEQLVNKRHADGIVVLIPLLHDNNNNNSSSSSSSLSSFDYETWQQTERSLLQQMIKGAIYFLPASPSALELYEELEKELVTNVASSFLNVDSYRFEVASAEGALIPEIKIHNIQGWLAGAGKRVSSDNLPTIALVASYDTFGIAPALATGVDSNGSGVVALLELARLFSRLYRSSKTHADFNILFLLTGAGRMNFVDTSVWLEKEADPRLLESIEFALCLDTIGSGEGLKLHVSRTEKDPKAKQLFDVFTATASQMSMPFEIVHKKINISSREVPWQHEQFSRKYILGGTLSRLEKAMPLINRSYTFDTSLDINALSKNVKFIAEGLARYIYEFQKPNISVFEDDLSVSIDFMESWVNIVSQHPRMMPYLSYNQYYHHRYHHNIIPNIKGSKENIFISGLEKELNKYLTDVTKKTSILTKQEVPQGVVVLHFYDKTVATLSAFRGKPVSFDIILSVFVLMYLSLLYTFLKGTRNTWLQLTQIFVSNKTKRVR